MIASTNAYNANPVHGIILGGHANNYRYCDVPSINYPGADYHYEFSIINYPVGDFTKGRNYLNSHVINIPCVNNDSDYAEYNAKLMTQLIEVSIKHI